MLLIPAQTIARGWREIDTEEGRSPTGGPGDGSNGNGLMDEVRRAKLEHKAR